MSNKAPLLQDRKPNQYQYSFYNIRNVPQGVIRSDRNRPVIHYVKLDVYRKILGNCEIIHDDNYGYLEGFETSYRNTDLLAFHLNLT